MAELQNPGGTVYHFIPLWNPALYINSLLSSALIQSYQMHQINSCISRQKKLSTALLSLLSWKTDLP